jgi:hypothetical protein
MTSVIRTPTETKPTTGRAIAAAGYTGYRNRLQFLVWDDPLVRELTGPRAKQTLERMSLDPLISGVASRTGLLLRAPEWSLEPGGDQPIDAEFRDFVWDNVQNLDPGWRATIGGTGDMLIWGFDLHEALFERVDGNIMWAGFSPRDQRTIDRWVSHPQTGRLVEVHQRLDTGEQARMDAWKLLHFRTDPAAGRPEGRPLIRNAFLAWTDKQELRRIIKVGVRRDLTGMPAMEVPSRMLEPGADAGEIAARTEYERMVREVERDLREGLLLPSEMDEENKPTGYKFKLITSAGRRSLDLVDILEHTNREMALGMMAEFILLGHEKVGTQALGSVKTEMFTRAVGTWLEDIAEFMEKKATRVLQALNPRFASAAAPKWNHGEIEESAVTEFGQSVAQLVSAGALTAEPALEEWLRGQLGAPGVRGEEEL